MAYLDGEAILTRIRAVIEAGAGSLRTISPLTYDGGMYDDLDADEQSRRATVRPIVEATITGETPSPTRTTVPFQAFIVRWVETSSSLKIMCTGLSLFPCLMRFMYAAP